MIRPLAEPLGLYFRPGPNDHGVLLNLLAEGRSSFSGVVLDACYAKRQSELRDEVNRRGLESVLDTRAMELGTPGGFTTRRSQLPWGGARQHRPSDLIGVAGDDVADRIAQYVVANSYSSVLAPTHYLNSPNDPWLHVDRELTTKLRASLDRLQAHDMCIYLPLATSGAVFRDTEQREALLSAITDLPVDGIWLRIHPFGSDSGPSALSAYIDASRDIHDMGLPIVAEKTGTIGLALLAFGAVSGIESGVTIGEKFEVSRLLKPRSGGKPFGAQPRVYIPELRTFLSRVQANDFFQSKQIKAAFGCRDTECCRHGAQDMMDDPRRHFLITRMDEVGLIGRPPEQIRPSVYLEDILRPATDQMTRALRGRVGPEIRKTLQRKQRTLESWRIVLGEMARSRPPTSFSAPPVRRPMRRRPSA